MKTDDERRDLLERAQQIDELTRTPAWALLVDFVNEKRANMQRAIIAGLPQDQYQHDVAWLQGADYVIRANEYLHGLIEADTRARGELAEA